MIVNDINIKSEKDGYFDIGEKVLSTKEKESVVGEAGHALLLDPGKGGTIGKCDGGIHEIVGRKQFPFIWSYIVSYKSIYKKFPKGPVPYTFNTASILDMSYDIATIVLIGEEDNRIHTYVLKKN